MPNIHSETEYLRFTVVIPLYNKARHILPTLQSVLRQSFTEFEVIVVDDGSTDGGSILVTSLEDTRVRVISQKNSGVAAARNIGIAEASSQYIAFLDADDEWTENHLSELSAMIDDFPGMGLYSSAHDIIRNGKIYQARQPWPGCHRAVIADFCSVYAQSFALVNSSTACISRDLLVALQGFPVGINKGEDVIVWIKAALHSGISYSTRVCTRINKDADARSTLNLSPEIPYFLIWLDREIALGNTPKSAHRLLLKLVCANAAGSRLSGYRRIPLGYHELDIAKRWHVRFFLFCADLAPPFLLQMVQRMRKFKSTSASK